MKKQIIIIVVSLFLVIFGFIGCLEDTTGQTDSNNENDDSNDNGDSDNNDDSDDVYHEPVTLYVDDDGSVLYKNIKDAVDNASDGDTIFVYNGIYDGEIKIDKSIILQGEDKTNTVIDGTFIGGAHLSGGDVGLTITADDVSISGFNIQNSKNDVTSVAIKIHGAQNVTIFNNIINNTDEGIVIEVERDGAMISSSNDRSKNNIIRDNEIETETSCIDIDKYSHYNIIQNNILKKGCNSIAIYSDSNTISGNIITSSECDGIHIYSNADYNTIYQNDISNCDTRGIYVDGDNNIIYLNNIYDNSKDTNYEHNAYNRGENTWYNESLMKGNYYGDFYTGVDNNGDDIGDTEYEIPGGEDKDLYPLIGPVDI